MAASGILFVDETEPKVRGRPAIPGSPRAEVGAGQTQARESCRPPNLSYRITV